MKFTYLRVVDKKTKDFPKPYNLSVPFEKGWNKSVDRALVVIGFIQSDDLFHKRLLSPKSAYTNAYISLIKEAENISNKHGYKYGWKYTFYNFPYFKWMHLDANKQDHAKYLAEKRLKRYIKRIKPTLIITIGDEIAERLLNRDVKHMRGCLFKYNDIPLVNTMSINLPLKSSDFDKNFLKKVNTFGYMSRNISTGLMMTNPFTVADVKPCPYLTDTIPSFDSLMSMLVRQKAVSIDLETENLQIHDNKVLTIQFAVSGSSAYILPIYHKDSPWSAKQLSYIKSKLKKYFSRRVKQYNGDETRYLIGQNFGFDLRIIMKWLKIPYIYYPIWDLMSGEYLHDENMLSLYDTGINPFGLNQIAAHYSNDFYFKKSGFGKKDRSNIKDYALKDIMDYCAMDVQLPYAIHKKQIEKFKRDDVTDYHKLMLLHQSLVVKMTSLMEFRGTKLDVDYILNLLKPDSEFIDNINDIVSEFYSLPEVKKASKLIQKRDNIPQTLFKSNKVHFSLNDTKHKRILFIDVLKLKPLKVSSKTKNPSFDIHFLEKYASKHKSINLLLRLSKLNTLKSTFIDAFYQHMSESDDGKIDGRIRPKFGSCSTVTGRSNSSKPSLQQIPEHSADAKIAKRMLIVPPQHIHFEADYSAHEVRCWGIISKDKAIGSAFKRADKAILKYRKASNKVNKERKDNEGDIHKQTYSFFTGVDINKVDTAMRQQSKGITFGLMYGMSSNSMSDRIKKPLGETERIVKRFFGQFKEAHRWLEKSKRHAQKHYWVSNPVGRRRNLSGYMIGDRHTNSNLDRLAMNSPIQGFASDISFISADIYTRALNRCLKKLQYPPSVLPVGPNAFVHDSLKGESHFDLFLLNLHLIEWSMTEGVKKYFKRFYDYDISIPLAIEIEIGSDWSNKKKWDWSSKNLDSLIINAVESHKKLYKSDKIIQSLNSKKVLRCMKRSYSDMNKVLDLDKNYPINRGYR